MNSINASQRPQPLGVPPPPATGPTEAARPAVLSATSGSAFEARASRVDVGAQAAQVVQTQAAATGSSASTLREVRQSLESCAPVMGAGYTVSQEGNSFRVQDAQGAEVMSLRLTGNVAQVSVRGIPGGEFSLGRRPSEAIAALTAGVQAQGDMPGFTVHTFNDYQTGAPGVSLSAGHDGPDHMVEVRDGSAYFSTGNLRGIEELGSFKLGNNPMTAITNALQVHKAAGMSPGAEVRFGADREGKPMAALSTADGRSFEFPVTGAGKGAAYEVVGGKRVQLDGDLSLSGNAHELEKLFRSGKIPGDFTQEQRVVQSTTAALERRAVELNRSTGGNYAVSQSTDAAGRTQLSLTDSTGRGESWSFTVRGNTAHVTSHGGETGNYQVGDLRMDDPAQTLATYFAAERLAGPYNQVTASLQPRGGSQLSWSEEADVHSRIQYDLHTDFSGRVHLSVTNHEGESKHLTSVTPGYFGRTETEAAFLLAREFGPENLRVREGTPNVFEVTTQSGESLHFVPTAGGRLEVSSSHNRQLPELVLGESPSADFYRYLSDVGAS